MFFINWCCLAKTPPKNIKSKGKHILSETEFYLPIKTKVRTYVFMFNTYINLHVNSWFYSLPSFTVRVRFLLGAVITFRSSWSGFRCSYERNKLAAAASCLARYLNGRGTMWCTCTSLLYLSPHRQWLAMFTVCLKIIQQLSPWHATGRPESVIKDRRQKHSKAVDLNLTMCCCIHL